MQQELCHFLLHNKTPAFEQKHEIWTDISFIRLWVSCVGVFWSVCICTLCGQYLIVARRIHAQLKCEATEGTLIDLGPSSMSCMCNGYQWKPMELRRVILQHPETLYQPSAAPDGRRSQAMTVNDKWSSCPLSFLTLDKYGQVAKPAFNTRERKQKQLFSRETGKHRNKITSKCFPTARTNAPKNMNPFCNENNQAP